MSKADIIQALVEPAINALGLDLWGVELLSQGRKSLLRVYIDKEAGVDVDDCARVSHQVSGILDVEDPISSEYVLEVSSPGMDRPLFTLSQFADCVGEMVSIRLNYAFEGRKKFKGQLSGIEGDDIVLQIDDEEYLLPFDAIDKANLVFRD